MHFGQWHPLGETGVHYWRVQRMAKSCDVNTARAAADGRLDQKAWADMVQRCRGCAWVDGCERWLHSTEYETDVAPPNTCLNADILTALAQGQKQC